MVKVELRPAGKDGSDVVITVYEDEVPIQRVIATVGYRTLREGRILPYVTTTLETPGMPPMLTLVQGKGG